MLCRGAFYFRVHGYTDDDIAAFQQAWLHPEPTDRATWVATRSAAMHFMQMSAYERADDIRSCLMAGMSVQIFKSTEGCWVHDRPMEGIMVSMLKFKQRKGGADMKHPVHVRYALSLQGAWTAGSSTGVALMGCLAAAPAGTRGSLSALSCG